MDTRMRWGAVALAVAASLAYVTAQQPGTSAGQIALDPDDIGGVVRSAKGPEAGVWVIAETTELPTRLIKSVVTDDQGRYVIPDLPKASYQVFARGYGLVDSQKVKAAPGQRLDLTAVVAPDGKTVSTIPTLRFKPSPLLQPWGSDAAELRFTAGEEEPGTLSSCVIGAGGSARVEKAPFSIGKIQLQVMTNGECLNLRTEPNPTATTVTCLKDGTLLDVNAGFVGTNPAPVQSDEAAGTGLFKCGAGFDFGTPVSAIEGWVHVQVAGLGEGWVSTEYVDWAN